MGLFLYGYWYWMVCGILIAYIIIFNLCFALSITFMGAPQKTRAQLSEAQLAEQAAILAGKGIEQLTKQSTSLPRSRSSSSLSRSRLSGMGFYLKLWTILVSFFCSMHALHFLDNFGIIP
ncbi:unnamed protein product [Calypogeia fissa]